MKTQHTHITAAVLITVLLLTANFLQAADSVQLPKARILLLPFVSLTADDDTRQLIHELYRTLYDAIDCQSDLECTGDLDNPITETTVENDEMRSQGETAQVDWVIAGELQGKSSGWELFLRILIRQL